MPDRLGPYALGAIHQADCLAGLRALPEGSVQCIVTSPPYWGLRDYGLPPSIWDGDKDCDHEWRDAGQRCRGGEHGQSGQRANRSSVASQIKAQNASFGEFCKYCGAWKGQLGLEPLPSLYIKHLVTIFREARRGLRKDGTVWLIMGDSYSGGRVGRADSYEGREIDGKRVTQKQWSAPTHRPVTSGMKPHDLCLIPARVALALQADGWWLRSDIIWHKPNAMPESVTSRPTRAHEFLFLLTKSGRALLWWHRDGRMVRKRPPPDYRWRHRKTNEERPDDPGDPDTWRRVNLWRGEDYYYDHEAILEPFADCTASRIGQSTLDDQRGGVKSEAYVNNEPGRKQVDRRPADVLRHMRDNPKAGRNKRSVWTISTQPYPGAHFAVFPPKLVEPCILAGCPEGGIVCDPFAGSGTTGIVCGHHGRRFIGFDVAGGNKDLGGHTANERIYAAYKGISLKEHLSGQEVLFGG